MTDIGSVYGEALYSLAREEADPSSILKELETVRQCFQDEPQYLTLLAAPSLPKAERCKVLDDCFRNQVHPFLLNFLKILTEKGYIRHFSACVNAYRALYDQDNDILRVTAITSVPLNQEQSSRLENKLAQITNKRIALTNKLDKSILGGIRLDYEGKRVDGTVANRLDAVAKQLKNAVL